jgi:hypothetical protein
MNAQRHHCIEHEILRLTLENSDHLGYSTSLPTVTNAFRQWLPDILHREIVDALKRLSPKYLTLLKWSNQHGQFIEYPTDISNDGEFFYRGAMRLRRTPHTDPYLQELAALFPSPEEPEKPKTPIGFQP